MTIEDLVQRYVDTRRQAERLKREKAKAETAFRIAEKELADYFVQSHEGFDLRKRETPSYRKGALFSLKQQFRFSLTEGNTPAVIEWLSERGEEEQDYTKLALQYTPTKKLLYSVYKDEGELALPGGSGDLIKLDTQPGITVTGWQQHYQEEA